MKKSIVAFAIVALAFTTISISCADDSEKIENAKEDVVDAKDDLADAQNEAATNAAKAATVEEWKLFKIESETQIQRNEAEIARLKISLNKAGNRPDAEYARSIEELEQKNKDIKAKVNNYETSQSDWAIFRREYNYDMESLGAAIKDLGTNNRK